MELGHVPVGRDLGDRPPPLERGGYDSHEKLRAKERKWAWAYLWFVLAVFAIGFVVGLAG